jgi:hypothetical protein
MQMPQPWWRTDEYTFDVAVPKEIEDNAGPKGIAVTRVWPDGTTDPGWGMPSFMEKYSRGKYTRSLLPILQGYGQEKWAFAFIMRSMRLVCIDIDGKNGGFTGIGKLGMLPYTLSETSKSGNGYHLFYTVSDDEWDDSFGFAAFSDRIGLQQGVDFRATGCVYHYPSQRWNDRQIVELPEHIKSMLRERSQKAAAQISNIIKVLSNGDEEEVLLMQDALVEDLKKPIPAGRRNNTLFAIGSQLFLAGRQDWEILIRDRAMQLGLASDETDKLVRNISAYAPSSTVAP